MPCIEVLLNESRPVLKHRVMTALAEAGFEVAAGSSPRRAALAIADSHMLMSGLGHLGILQRPVIGMVEGIADPVFSSRVLFHLSGLVDCDELEDGIVRAVTEVSQGRGWISPHLVFHYREALTSFAAPPWQSWKRVLTAREFQVAQAVIEGLSNREVAARLGISERTVKGHVHSVFDKLGCVSRAALISLAFGHASRQNGDVRPASA